jgi:predicted N-acetyltransferase YhbS
MTPTIRPAAEIDSSAIQSLINGLLHVFDSEEQPDKSAEVKASCLKLGLADAAAAMVAEENGKIIGYARLAGQDGIYVLSHLFVNTNCQRSGVGKQLWKALVAGRELSHVTVKSSVSAVPFYKQLGFRESSIGYQSTVIQTLTR